MENTTEQVEEDSHYGIQREMSPSSAGGSSSGGAGSPVDSDPSLGSQDRPSTPPTVGSKKGKRRSSSGDGHSKGGKDKSGDGKGKLKGKSCQNTEEGDSSSSEEESEKESSPGVGKEASQLAEVLQTVAQASKWGEEIYKQGEASLQWLTGTNLKWEDARQEISRHLGESSSSAEEREREGEGEGRGEASQVEGRGRHLSLAHLIYLIALIGITIVAYWLISIALYYGTILLIAGLLALIVYRRTH